MASYAALLSAMHTLNLIKRHPRPPISLDPKQMESLTQNITFLLNFLERYSGKEDEDLESRIAASAYAAEDVIETHIVDRIHSGSDISTVDLYQGLEKVIQEMDLIKMEETIKEMKGVQIHDKLPRNSSFRPASTRQSNIMVEFDDVLVNEVLDKLTGHQSSFQVIPIVGMGGIGKTSLARNIYKNPLTVEHFDILVWVTISQEYNVSVILSQVLSEEKKGMSECELGDKVHKKLCGRRYLIVMDDIWSIEAWDQVNRFFPDNNTGSRVMITTRLSKLAFDISGSRDFQMDFLDENKSWALFCKTVFGKEGCPIELEDTAKKIVRNCRGLPLSIVVIGGLLTNSNMTPTYWEYILENLSSLINLEDDEYCLRLLRTSYKELPIHLKSCFLYMGIFPEDDEIRVSKLVKLWVAEGILRPSENKRLEEVAEEYVMELVERNLISVHKLRWDGEVKLFKMHDLLRDLCLREGRKQRFLCPIKVTRDLKIPKYMNISTLYEFPSSWALLWNLQTIMVDNPIGIWNLHEVWEMVLLRHVNIINVQLPDPPCGENGLILQDLQTLSCVNNLRCSKEVIKRIQNIRILKLLYVISSGETEYHRFYVNNFYHLKNLQSLNIKHLITEPFVEEFGQYMGQNLNFPHSLKKLTLRGNMFNWEECRTKIGLLPFLEYLKLDWDWDWEWNDNFQALMLREPTFNEWETVEGQFCSLKFLHLRLCRGLRYWKTDNTHFSRLEHLVLEYLNTLEEIPSSIGDIPTLKSIRLYCCSKSAVDSARRIKAEQIELGNEDLQVIIGYTVDSDSEEHMEDKEEEDTL